MPMKTDGEFYSYKKNNREGYEGYSDPLITCIEDTCAECIKYASKRNRKNNDESPIMMLGKIQSGKTRAFTGLIALAFDNKFDMVFILTKNSKALVKQTVNRMNEEFTPFVDQSKLIISDIVTAELDLTGYEINQRQIIVAKKETKNLDKIIEFIANNSTDQDKRYLIIDDEADTTGIGFEIDKESGEFNLRTVASKVNEVRGCLDGCVFVQVTATPYSLYLQPDTNSNITNLKPIKPKKTFLVPHGDEYIGGEYYFIESKKTEPNGKENKAFLLYNMVTSKEQAIISTKKIKDGRSCNLSNIILDRNLLPIFKSALVNFIIAVIVLNKNNQETKHYSFVFHTAREKGLHEGLAVLAKEFFNQIKNRNKVQEHSVELCKAIEELVHDGYENIKKSVVAYGLSMPQERTVEKEFYQYVEAGNYSINIVNADQDVEKLLNEKTGELRLRTPCSIFIGGQVLDRGVTVPKMIAFYYTRNPKVMQQDTVLQHSRMFGYRKNELHVTRLYTTEEIYHKMEQMTEFDLLLREDIEKGEQGNGVYFITRQLTEQAKYGKIVPCSADKIKTSNILTLKKHQRIIPFAFMPVKSSKIYEENTQIIDDILGNQKKSYDGLFAIDKVLTLVEAVYATITPDNNDLRFIPKEQMITLIKYLLKENKEMHVVVKRDKKNIKIRSDGRLFEVPDHAKQERQVAIELAEEKPVLILLQENGEDETWGGRPFWWPVLIAPKETSNTIYADATAKKTARPKTKAKSKAKVRVKVKK